MLKRSCLIATKLYVRQNSPIDPFFIIQIFWNEDSQKSCVKVTRVGINRQHFARFYRIEDKILTSNLRHFPFELNFESFEQIAAESVSQREWGLRLIEPVSQAEWGVVAIQEKELPHKFTTISASADYITLSSRDQQLHFQIEVKDTLEASTFTLTNSEKIPDRPLEAAVVHKEEPTHKYEIK